MPGMGLTAIGVTGVTLAYSGIAHTFVDGMHALTGLTMIIGMIFLSAGILDGGISTSNRAKATTLVILSIALSFGAFAFTRNTISTTATFAGVMLMIVFPAVMMAYIAMKHPKFLKPIGIIFTLAAAAGISAYIGFGLVGPDPYLIPKVETPAEEAKEMPSAPAGPIFAITILENSSQQGNPDYDPDVATVQQGYTVEWTNKDSTVHTVTSAEDFGDTFNSDSIAAGGTYRLDTSKINPGTYEYTCAFHPWMQATLKIEEAKPAVVKEVSIAKGAGIQSDGQLYFDPAVIQVEVGTTVSWTNNDETIHTVTAGNLNDGPTGEFDSDMIPAGGKFEHTFTTPGKTDYFCIVHPWMQGSVDVE